jgi:hypothetical protein
MKLTVTPPLSEWVVAPPRSARDELASIVNANADRLGTGRLDSAKPIIATGHQAFLWHPGILAKDFAVSAAADRVGGQALHVVVDQDVHEATTLDVPYVASDRIMVDRVGLAPQRADVPTGSHEPVLFTPEHPDLPRSLRDALRDMPTCESLAEQIAVALTRLRRPLMADMPILFAGQMGRLAAFSAMIDRMLDDPRRCILAYNAAVTANPDAGIEPLQLTREHVEIPLWRVRRGEARQRVFADIADSRAMLVSADGSTIADRHELAPRALMLTATMRWACCDWFIHGLGGGIYDRVTEQWWQAWTGDMLAPMAVVTADLHLPLDAPVAESVDLARAVWYAHHLPHNLDRVLGVAADLSARKRALIEAMAVDRDRRRRATAFADIHRINRSLVAAYPGAMAEAKRNLDRARIAVTNRLTAMRRDWCFALYPTSQLIALRDAIARSATIAV